MSIIIIKQKKIYVFDFWLFGQTIGTVWGSLKNPKLTFNGNVKLRAGANKISMLSVSVGLAVSLNKIYIKRKYLEQLYIYI